MARPALLFALSMALARVCDLSLDRRSRAMVLCPRCAVPVAGCRRAFLHVGRKSGTPQPRAEAPAHVGQDRCVAGAIPLRLGRQSAAARRPACPGVGAADTACRGLVSRAATDEAYIPRIPLVRSSGH